MDILPYNYIIQWVGMGLRLGNRGVFIMGVQNFVTSARKNSQKCEKFMIRRQLVILVMISQKFSNSWKL